MGRVSKRRATKFLTEHEIARLKKLCETFTQADAARIVGCTAGTVSALKKRGWVKFNPRKNARKKPSDFNLLANKMSVTELQKHYHTSQDYIMRWLVGVDRKYKPKPYQRAFPVPGDFRAIWSTMQAKEIAAHYGVSRETVTRWRKECALPSKWAEKKLRNFELRHKSPIIGWVEQFVQSKQYRRAA